MPWSNLKNPVLESRLDRDRYSCLMHLRWSSDNFRLTFDVVDELVESQTNYHVFLVQYRSQQDNESYFCLQNDWHNLALWQTGCSSYQITLVYHYCESIPSYNKLKVIAYCVLNIIKLTLNWLTSDIKRGIIRLQ